MTVREIITVPDKRLRQISSPVKAVTDATRALMGDMLETMYASNGIGLAAIQIGVATRVIVMDLSQSASDDEDDPLRAEKVRYFANPEILWASEETRNYAEGCLSVPGFYEDVARPAQCRIGFLDYDGKEQTLDCDGLLATCIQHEIDHLNGVVFLDHLSRLKRDMAIKNCAKPSGKPQRNK